jgi:hypothetical protein
MPLSPTIPTNPNPCDQPTASTAGPSSVTLLHSARGGAAGLPHGMGYAGQPNYRRTPEIIPYIPAAEGGIAEYTQDADAKAPAKFRRSGTHTAPCAGSEMRKAR